MDYSQLLNTSTPFDDMKLQMLDTLTNTLYTTINNNDVRINKKFFREK